MLKAMALGRPPLADACAGRDALELVLAIYQSQMTGQVVRLPLKKFTTTQMAGTL